MMGDISIVTAFFDIGRGDFINTSKIKKTARLPEMWQQRSVETYFDYFNHLASIENELIVYTTIEFAEKIYSIRKNKGLENKTKIVVVENYLPKELQFIKENIEKIMLMPEFYEKLVCPGSIEYWHSDYVLINILKSLFVSNSIEAGFIDTDLISWIDFGYCRSESTIPFPKKWSYNFDTSKIHLFNLRPIDENRPIDNIIYTGDVYIQGCHIVAGKQMWPVLRDLMMKNLMLLINHNLIDDDQTLLLMSYLTKKEIFELRFCDPRDWFIIFKLYNKEIKIND